MEGLGKSRRDGGTLREKRDRAGSPRGGYQVIWGPVRNVGIRKEVKTTPVLVLGLGATQRAPLGHGCRSFQMPSCPGFCDTQLCTQLQARHEDLRSQNLGDEGEVQAAAANRM